MGCMGWWVVGLSVLPPVLLLSFLRWTYLLTHTHRLRGRGYSVLPRSGSSGTYEDTAAFVSGVREKECFLGVVMAVVLTS